MKLLFPFTFSLILSATVTSAAQPTSPEFFCQQAFGNSSILLKCAFVTERTGAQYYLLQFDMSKVGKALSDPQGPEVGMVLNLVSLPTTIIAFDLDHPLATVRIAKPEGGYLELTHGGYRECVLLHGDPEKFRLPEDAKRRDAFRECIVDKLTQGGK